MTPTVAVLIIFLTTCAALITLVFAKPAVMIGGKKISIFWLAPLAGAVALPEGAFHLPPRKSFTRQMILTRAPKAPSGRELPPAGG